MCQGIHPVNNPANFEKSVSAMRATLEWSSYGLIVRQSCIENQRLRVHLAEYPVDAPYIDNDGLETNNFSNAGRWPAWRRIEKICVSWRFCVLLWGENLLWCPGALERSVVVTYHEDPGAPKHFYFCPDQLAGDLAPELHTLGGDDWLMVRGEFPPEGRPCMLPRTARC